MKRKKFLPFCVVAFLFLGSFADISFAQDTNSFTPPKVVVEYSGNKAFSDEILTSVSSSELARLKESARYSSDFTYVLVKEHIADDAAFKIREYYQMAGFHFAEVKYSFSNIANGKRVVFQIAEHNRISISEVSIVGNTEFSKDFTQKILLDIRGGQVDLDKLIFVERNIQKGLKQLQDLYIEAGYFDFKVRSLDIIYDSDPSEAKTAIVVLILNEGLKYNITKFSPSGETEGYDNQLVRELREFIGKQFNSKTRLLISDKILEFYKQRGYWNCKVELSAENNPEDGHIEIKVNVQSGEKYRLNNFFFNKTNSIRDSFLKSLLTMEEGDYYDVRKERESIRRLLRTNLLSDIDIKYYPIGDGLLDCNVSVKERWLSEIKAVVGYGSYEKFMGYIQLADNNLFGIGRRAALKFGGSEMSQFVEGEIKDPWTLGLTNTSLSVSPFFRRRVEPLFTLQEFGFSTKIEYLLTNKITLAMEYELKDSRSFNLDDPQLILPEELIAYLGSVRAYFLYDDRDSILNPTEGMRNVFRLEYYSKMFGGSTDFIKFSTINSFYSSLGDNKKIVFAFKFISTFWVKISDFVPIQERMYNGGEASVRCFFEQEMKPGDNPDATGGQVKNVASAEMRVPLIWEWGLDAAAFIDIGNLSAEIENYFSNWEVGVGVGMRYLTPFGVLRLDVAVNVEYFDDPTSWAYHLSLGYPF